MQKNLNHPVHPLRVYVLSIYVRTYIISQGFHPRLRPVCIICRLCSLIIPTELPNENETFPLFGRVGEGISDRSLNDDACVHVVHETIN